MMFISLCAVSKAEPVRKSVFPAPSIVPPRSRTLCSPLLCLPASIAVPERVCSPVPHVSAQAGLKPVPLLRNNGRSRHPPQALAPTPCLTEGRAQPQSAAQFSSATNKADHYVRFYPKAIQQLTTRAEEPARLKFHLQVDLRFFFPHRLHQNVSRSSKLVPFFSAGL